LFTKYHLLSQGKAERFIQCVSDVSEDVACQLSEQHRKVALENLERLVLAEQHRKVALENLERLVLFFCEEDLE